MRAELALLSNNRALAEQMAERASAWWRDEATLQHSAGYPGGRIGSGGTPTSPQTKRAAGAIGELPNSESPATQ
jgi:hypothetical protein